MDGKNLNNISETEIASRDATMQNSRHPKKTWMTPKVTLEDINKTEAGGGNFTPADVTSYS